MNTIKDFNLFTGKNVLFRTDFDVPLDENKMIAEPYRVKKQKAGIDLLMSSGAKIGLIAHITSVDSFNELRPQFEELLGRKIIFVQEVEQLLPAVESAVNGELVLLENTRKFKGEKDNDEEFAKKLSQGFHYYINNAFAVCHRKHATIYAITKYLNSFAGPLVQEEVVQLEKVLLAPKEGKIFIMGGAKGETKVPVIKNFLDKAERVLIGGVIANDFLKVEGEDIKKSRVDDDPAKLLEGVNPKNPALVLPEDYIWADEMILDIGPKTILNFSDIATKAKMIIWNGPMGWFEKKGFEKGTEAIAVAVASSKGFKLLGGGDTVAAVSGVGLDKFDFVSTGGGAMLSFLSGEILPGLEALDYKR
jgi:phosphoglycerate kinase